MYMIVEFKLLTIDFKNEFCKNYATIEDRKGTGMNKEVMTSYAANQILMEIILEQGMHPMAFEQLTGVSRNQIQDPDERIPLRSVLKLWQIAIDLTGDPAMALCLRKKVGLQYVHFLISLGHYSSNLLEAAHHISRYMQLISDAERCDIFDMMDHIKIVLTNSFPEYQNRWIPEHHFSLVVETARSLVGSKMNPLAIHFQHANPGYTDVYDEVFRAPVLFEQPENVIIFKKDDFLQPITSHDPNIEAALKNYAELSLQKITRTGSLKEKVCGHIIDSLPGGGIEVKKVAGLVNMSVSTMYRELKMEGTTFKDLLLKTRQELAKTYLLQGMTNGQVTYLLGFSEPAVFQRAFKRWFGFNPGEYKKSMSKR